MLKGAQKRMIVIKTADSKVFDEAYFLVKSNYDGEELDMVAEADRIAAGIVDKKEESRRRGRIIESAVIGIGCGAVGASLGLIVSMLFKFGA